MKWDSEIQDTYNLWLQLDNAAKIYPAVIDRELTSVFRASVELKERIKAKAFSETLKDLEDRFPYYKVKIRAGFFWYFLETANLPFQLVPDQGIPCRAFHKEELMFRVLVKDRTISVEFSHILTDGNGALEFLKSILLTYLVKCGLSAPPELTYLLPEATPAREEYEDAFNRYFKRVGSKRVKLQKVFLLPFPLKQKPRFDPLTAIMPMDVVLKKARALDVSITEYLVAVYLHSLQRIYEQLPPFRKRSAKKILRVQVPVNLRQLFPSKTMRNFTLFVLPEIDLHLGHYTFEEITKVVHHQMRLETDKKVISKIIARNVGAEKNVFIRSIPLFFKSILLMRQYWMAAKKFSGVASNMGKIDLGPEVNAYIDKFIFIAPPANNALKVNCAIVGFDNKLVLTFGNITTSKELERQFMTFLTGEGVAVKILNPNQ